MYIYIYCIAILILINKKIIKRYLINLNNIFLKILLNLYY